MVTRTRGANAATAANSEAAKWQAAAQRAASTAKMANTLAKALARRVKGRWKLVDFTSERRFESAGIVDILAIRKSSKPPSVAGLKKLDLFDIIVIQVKGGSAPWPTAEDAARLRRVAKHYRATHVACFQWLKERSSGFYVLEGGDWTGVSAEELFR